VARIQVGGAGGAPAHNLIRSLREAHPDDYLIGTSSVASDLILADVDEAHLVPYAYSADYEDALLSVLKRSKPELLMVQHDFEVLAVSRLREKIRSEGVSLFLPAPETIETCVDKYRSYEVWAEGGLRVPLTRLIRSEADVDAAFQELRRPVWLRMRTGGGGRGAIATRDPHFAKLWIERLGGWGEFTAAEKLSSVSVTWSSIWHEGALVVAQSRRRLGWAMGDRAPSGVTGVTRIAETLSDPEVDQCALSAIRAVDSRPHGVFSVDMTLDQAGTPCPTEINIGRFFTTIYFFTAAGLNMPAICRNIALTGDVPSFDRKINPLPVGLMWLRSMDRQPVICSVEEFRRIEAEGFRC